MSGMKKALTLILALMMVMTFGTVLVSAVSVSDGEAVAEAAPSAITVHVRQDGLV